MGFGRIGGDITLRYVMLTNQVGFLELVPSWPYAGAVGKSSRQCIDALLVNARATMA